MGWFSQVSLAPMDPVLGLTVAFLEDKRSEKVNLGAGIYRGEDLKTPILESVKEAERCLLESEVSKEYLPIGGMALFIEKMGELGFGNLWEKERKRVCGFQSVGGTGALRMGAKFLQKECTAEIFVPQETWPNHRGVFGDSFLKVHSYPYYDAEKGCVAFDKMMECLQKIPEGSLLLLHACCHNPTGADLTEEQWDEVALLCQRKRLLAFIDCAYQGFGRSFEKDAYALRRFLEKGIPFLVAMSCSKNFGLYGERAGALFVVTDSPQVADCVKSRIHQLIRTDYTTPPLHGGSIVAHILTSDRLKEMWEGEVETMRSRMMRMRVLFAEGLMQAQNKKDYSYLKKTFGMFAFCGLGREQTQMLIAKYGIYMMADGRLNLCGLNEKNMPLVIRGIAEALNG